MEPVPVSGSVRAKGNIPRKIALIYLVVGCAYILLSDRLVEAMFASPRVVTRIGIYKGWGFVAVTALILYFLTRHYLARVARSEEALARSRDHWLSLLDEFPSPVCRTDLSGRCDYVNRTWSDFTGRTPAQEKDQGWKEGIHPEDRARVEEEIRAAVAGLLPATSEFRLRRADGEYRWMVLGARPYRDVEGEVRGFIGACYDVTDRKKLEEESLRATNLESIGTLAGGIAHDFNNLLTAIMGNISMAKMMLPPGADSARKLDEAERASLRARGLTQQLLTFSRGGVPIRHRTNIGALVREAVHAALREAKVRLDIRISPDLAHADVDPAQMHRVFENLVRNAHQAMPEGGTVTVRGENVTVRNGELPWIPPGTYIRFDVVDQGVGIPSGNLQKIFDPFFTTKPKGSGLGLPTAYSIVKRHDGIITVDSTPGSGSVFSVYLPVSSELPPERKDEEMPRFYGPKKILVMDDEEMVQGIALDILRSMGYEAVGAYDGVEAVEAYRKAMEAGDPFHLVIMDLTVPGGMGGEEAMRELRKIDPNVKAIVSSGYSNDPVMDDYRKYGFFRMIAKPYDIREFQSVVGEALRS